MAKKSNKDNNLTPSADEEIKQTVIVNSEKSDSDNKDTSGEDLKESVNDIIDVQSKETDEIQKRSRLIASANRKIFDSNKKLFSVSAAAFENNADKVANFMAEFGSDISERLRSTLEEISKISQDAVGATFTEMKELRDRSEVVKSTIDELNEIGIKGADAGSDLADEQLELLKKNTTFLKGIKDGIKKSLKDDIVGRLESISLGPIPIGRIVKESLSQKASKGDRAKEITSSRLNVLREEKQNIRERIKESGGNFEIIGDNELKENLSTEVDGISEELFLSTTGKIFEVLSSIDDSTKGISSTTENVGETSKEALRDAKLSEHNKEEDKREAKDSQEDLLEVLSNIKPGNALNDKETSKLDIAGLAGGGLLAGATGGKLGVAELIGAQVLGKTKTAGKALSLLTKLPVIGKTLAAATAVVLGREVPKAVPKGIISKVSRDPKTGRFISSKAPEVLKVGAKSKALRAAKFLGKIAVPLGFILSALEGGTEAIKGYKQSRDFTKTTEVALEGFTFALADTFTLTLLPDKFKKNLRAAIDDTIGNFFTEITDEIKNVVEFFEDNFSLRDLLISIPGIGAAFTPKNDTIGRAKEANIISGGFIGKTKIIDHDTIMNYFDSKHIKDLIDHDDWSDSDAEFLRLAFNKKLRDEAKPVATVEQAKPDATIEQAEILKNTNTTTELIKGAGATPEMVLGTSPATKIATAQESLDNARKEKKQKELNIAKAQTNKGTNIINAPVSNRSTTVVVGETFYNSDPSYTRHENKNLIG